MNTAARSDLPEKPAVSGQAILIIDDEAVLARNIATYLQRLGWTTQVAGSAEEGLALYPSFRPDIVLLDHNLPGQTGLEALVKLRAMDADARVVLMTGNGGIELAVSAIKQGAADYLAKPLALSELRLLLDRLLAQSRLQSRVEYYRQREADHSGLDKIIGESPQVTALRERVCLLLGAERQLSDDNPPSVLIQGETGTGKELVARALHFGGARASQPFVELNCGALPPQLIEAELFGYEKGAFTDARQRKIGLVEAASGGTLFLDEIGEADPATQVKLLKLLEDRSFRRLGGIREQRANVRVIAATHRPLEQMVREGSFRADLYFRLRIIEVPVPALRERGTDVLLLARHFLQWHAQRYRRELPELGEELLLPLQRYPWPGNVRELRNAIEQALLLAPGARIGLREFGFLSTARDQQQPQDSEGEDDADDLNLERAERRLVQRALRRSGSNVTQAAKLLGVSRDTLRYRLERLNLRSDDAA